MNRQSNNHNDLTPYLLGALPETETERLDELSISDDGFVERLNAAEKELIDAYINDELSEADRELFESHFLASPLRRDKLKIGQALHIFAEHKGIHRRVVAEPAVRPRNEFRLFSIPRVALQWGALASVLVLALIGGWYVLRNNQQLAGNSQVQSGSAVASSNVTESAVEAEHGSTSQNKAEPAEKKTHKENVVKGTDEQNQTARKTAADKQRQSLGKATIAAFVLTPSLRGVAAIPEISLPAEADYVAMRLRLEPGANSAYRVALLGMSQRQAVWHSGILKQRTIDGGSVLEVTFPAHLLKQESYLLRVFSIRRDGSSEAIGEYPFRVLKS